MKGILFAFAVILALASCKEISFETPQPAGRKALTRVPKNLQGKYLPVTDDGQLSKDTVVVTENGYRFGYYDLSDRSAENDEYEKGVLSDTLILKSYRGYYFLNIDEKPEWLLRVFKQEKNGDLVYMTLGEKNTSFHTYLQKLSKEIRVDSIQLENETLYQIHPTPGQLVALINKGYFAQTKLVRIH